LRRGKIGSVLRERELGPRDVERALHVGKQLVDVSASDTKAALVIRIERTSRFFGHHAASLRAAHTHTHRSRSAAKTCQKFLGWKDVANLDNHTNSYQEIPFFVGVICPSWAVKGELQHP
jgi:hypothetical protein